jgi:hypothetical protein
VDKRLEAPDNYPVMRKSAVAIPSTMLVAAAVTVSIACVARACIGAAEGGAGCPSAVNPGPGYEPVQDLMGRLGAAARQVRSLKGNLARLHARPWRDHARSVESSAAAALPAVPLLPPMPAGVVKPFAFPIGPATIVLRAHLSDLPPPALS